jgi:hypothetical protein
MHYVTFGSHGAARVEGHVVLDGSPRDADGAQGSQSASGPARRAVVVEEETDGGQRTLDEDAAAAGVAAVGPHLDPAQGERRTCAGIDARAVRIPVPLLDGQVAQGHPLDDPALDQHSPVGAVWLEECATCAGPVEGQR